MPTTQTPFKSWRRPLNQRCIGPVLQHMSPTLCAPIASTARNPCPYANPRPYGNLLTSQHTSQQPVHWCLCLRMSAYCRYRRRMPLNVWVCLLASVILQSVSSPARTCMHHTNARMCSSRALFFSPAHTLTPTYASPCERAGAPRSLSSVCQLARMDVQDKLKSVTALGQAHQFGRL